MYVFYSRQDTLCKAILTERMQLYITGTNLLPSRAVAFVFLISPAVLFIQLIDYFLMLLAVQSVRQLRTAGISTGLLWFLWHRIHFLFGHRKSRRPVSITDPRHGFYLLFHNTIITQSLLYYTVFYCIVYVTKKCF